MAITFKELGNYGRAGNMLFQIAACIGLALRNNDAFIFPKWKYEQYFNIPPESFNDNIYYNKTYEEPFFHYQEIPYDHNLNIKGYFQSPLYFYDCESYIRKILTPRHIISPMLYTTSIHVRRTDYLKFSNCHTVLGMDYYYKAMDLCPSKRYLIFSDDIAWCKQNFIGNQFEFSEGNHEITDLAIQAACGRNIIANSSFSWWAAWLNKNEYKTVVAPLKWFGPDLEKTHDTKDLIPSSWIRV